MMSDIILCSDCKRSFTRKDALARHQKTCRKEVLSECKKIKCPTCDKEFVRHETLRLHASEDHGVNIECQNLKFKTYKDFKEWKETYEKENLCFYSVRSSKLKNDTKTTYFHCHRTGHFNTKSKGHRRIKSQGTNKINSSCTSSMVLQQGSTLNLKFYKTHFGHGSNVGRCNLSPDERAMIAGWIAEGVTFDEILDEIRDVRNLCDIQALTSKRDLHNIRRDLWKFSMDKTSESFLKLSKNQFYNKENAIARSHSRAVDLMSFVCKVHENLWNVRSSRLDEIIYEVSRIRDTCNTEDCNLLCRQCNVCIHMFNCDCPDFISRQNICKHIHACIINETERMPYRTTPDFSSVENAIVCEEDESETQKKIQFLLEKLKIAEGLLKSECQEFTSKDILKIEKKIDSLMDLVKCRKRKATGDTIKEPSNKKVEKQAGICTYEKKCSSEYYQSLKLATDNASHTIKEELSDLAHNIQVVHTGFDHNYS